MLRHNNEIRYFTNRNILLSIKLYQCFIHLILQHERHNCKLLARLLRICFSQFTFKNRNMRMCINTYKDVSASSSFIARPYPYRLYIYIPLTSRSQENNKKDYAIWCAVRSLTWNKDKGPVIARTCTQFIYVCMFIVHSKKVIDRRRVYSFFA